MQEIISTNRWDQDFFSKFNQVIANLNYALPESLDNLHHVFKADSLVLNNYQWQAFVLLINNQPVARAVLSWRAGLQTAHLGYIEFSCSLQDARNLLQAVEQFAKRESLQNIKGPVDINLFNKYRWRLPTSNEPLYSDTVVPEHYHELLKSSGYVVSNEWDTYSLNINEGRKRWREKRARNTTEKKYYQKNNFKLKLIFPWRINTYLPVIYQLFIDSYKNMEEFESISFESFKELTKELKYIISPWFSYLLFLEDKPVGFLISWFDPYKILVDYHKSEKKWYSKYLLLLKLQFNFKKLLLVYVGKNTDAKGFQVKTSMGVSAGMFLLRVKVALVCYQQKNSPSRHNFDQDIQTHYASYVVYQKKLS